MQLPWFSRMPVGQRRASIEHGQRLAVAAFPDQADQRVDVLGWDLQLLLLSAAERAAFYCN
jgi:hypothetical protein